MTHVEEFGWQMLRLSLVLMSSLRIREESDDDENFRFSSAFYLTHACCRSMMMMCP
jgi:hypothetical protein